MRSLFFTLGIALALGLTSTVSAQDAAQRDNAIGLPSWAAPSASPSTPDVESMVGPPPAPPTAPAQVPLDGGLGLLALAGGAYAAKRLRDRSA